MSIVCGEYSQLTVGSVPGQQILDDDVPERERHLDPGPHVQTHHLLEISQLAVPDRSLHHHGQTPLLRAEEGGGGGSEGEGDEVREDLEENGERERRVVTVLTRTQLKAGARQRRTW